MNELREVRRYEIAREIYVAKLDTVCNDDRLLADIAEEAVLAADALMQALDKQEKKITNETNYIPKEFEDE